MPDRVAPRLILAALLAAGLACGLRDGDDADPEVPVRVDTVAIDHHNAPVVLLQEEDGPRVLPIWIGTAEARSIALEINDQPSPRPNFHDLARRVIQRLDASVDRVVVTELRDDGIYYAILHLRTGSRALEIDVRPSDGIAVALRAQAPILVRASVFDAAGDTLKGHELPDPPAAEPLPSTGGRPIHGFPTGSHAEATRQLEL